MAKEEKLEINGKRRLQDEKKTRKCEQIKNNVFDCV
jgi:hypothetical protein